MTLFERIRRAIQSNKARMDDLRTNNRSLVDRNIETTNTIQRLDQEKSKLLSDAVTMKKNFQTAVQRIADLEEVVAGYEKAALENTGQSLDEGLEILRQELGLPETDPDAVVGEVVDRPASHSPWMKSLPRLPSRKKSQATSPCDSTSPRNRSRP